MQITMLGSAIDNMQAASKLLSKAISKDISLDQRRRLQNCLNSVDAAIVNVQLMIGDMQNS